MTEIARVADALQQGAIPWRLPVYPRNALSGKPYGGSVPILLNIAAGALGCEDCPWWGSLSDWSALKTRVPFGIGVRVPGCADPIHNWRFTDKAHEPPPLLIEDPTQVFEAIVKNAAIRIEHVCDSTCKYVGAGDFIVMPHRFMFEIGSGISGWHDALGHEIFHWSERRTGWDSNDDVAELRAEIGTGYLGALVGATPLPLRLARHHRTFAPRWIRMMKADPHMLPSVCQNVTATVAYLLRFAGLDVQFHAPTG